jgi:3-phosphoshikimate 1-carboxyvinyltransferase
LGALFPPELAIEPIHGPLHAVVEVPGSKSITNRALVCAALAPGRSRLTGALQADDTEAMVDCLRGLGVTVDVDWPTITVTGGGGLGARPARLDAAMSGTTARFVLPLLGLARSPVELTGHPALVARPMGESIGAVWSLGVDVDETGQPGHLPVRVSGTGSIQGGTLDLAGDVSSQFLSGLLLAGPAMDRGLDVRLTTPLVSRPYVDMTCSVMAAFGVPVAVGDGGRRFSVAPGGYRPVELTVEPDASAASYFFAAAAVLGGTVQVPGLGRRSVQGDLRFVEILGQMGCEVEVGADATTVTGGGGLRGVTVDMGDCSDTAQTLAAVAAFADGRTRITGIGFIRRKETDRIAATVAELRRAGVDAEEEPDGLVVRPTPGAPRGARIQTYDDHRMAMSFAVLGLRTPGTVVLDPGCVSKTFPGFFDTLDQLRPEPLR